MRIQGSDSYLKERNMMANQSGVDSHGQRTTQSRGLFQFALAMAFGIWLLFQINHQFDNQRHHQNKENMSIQDSAALLLGRKVNPGFMVGGLVHSYRGDNDIAGNSEKIKKLMREAREGLIGEGSVGFALIVERTGDGEVQDGGAVTYKGNVFEDENGVPPDVSGVYLMKSEEDSRNVSAGLGAL
ncbi:uncharacterized protein LOC115738118 [Rhodamnia argentea]|uniref:Uncharacterized protein LOC115738118 n=1 Tax=Rhodamnia argentea TaxID=178133 RepID=A0A8B8NVD8_9MYRT|nr:uncharacterized protein LOC115738118 [Rhodamnia argentea]